MDRFLPAAPRPVVPWHWKIDDQEREEYIWAGLEMPANSKRQFELYEKWKAENAKLDAPKLTAKQEAAGMQKRRVYGMT